MQLLPLHLQVRKTTYIHMVRYVVPALPCRTAQLPLIGHLADCMGSCTVHQQYRAAYPCALPFAIPQVMPPTITTKKYTVQQLSSVAVVLHVLVKHSDELPAALLYVHNDGISSAKCAGTGLWG